MRVIFGKSPFPSNRATIIQNIKSSEKRQEELRAQQTTTSQPTVFQKFNVSVRSRDARVDRGATEGSPSGHLGRATPRSGEDLPNLVQGSARVATDHRRAGFSDAIRSGEHGEVIRVRCGMTGVRVGEAANPGPGQSRCRRRVSSSGRGSWGRQCKSNRGGQ